MRKVHYKVVLDVFTNENDDDNGMEILEEADFWPDGCDKFDVLDVKIDNIEVTDSR